MASVIGKGNSFKIGLVTTWFLWHSFSLIRGQNTSPENPRIVIKAPLRVGDSVEMCCVSLQYKGIYASILFTIKPNNDKTVRFPVIDTDRGEISFCYTITVVFDHHMSSTNCFATYRFKCSDSSASCSPKEKRTFRARKLKVFVLRGPVVDGPKDAKADEKKCWTCEVPKVSYDVFEDDFSLVWLGEQLQGLSEAYIKRKTRLSSPASGPGSVLKMHKVVSEVCVRSPLPGRRRLECKVRVSSMPKGTFYKGFYNFSVIPNPKRKSSTTTVTTTTIKTMTTTTIKTTTSKPPAETSNKISSSTATMTTPRKPPAQSTKLTSTQTTLSTNETPVPLFTLQTAIIITTLSHSEFEKRPRLSQGSGGSTFLIIAIIASILIAIAAIAVVYRIVTKDGRKRGQSRKQESSAIQGRHSPSPSKHARAESRTAEPWEHKLVSSGGREAPFSSMTQIPVEPDAESSLSSMDSESFVSRQSFGADSSVDSLSVFSQGPTESEVSELSETYSHLDY